MGASYSANTPGPTGPAGTGRTTYVTNGVPLSGLGIDGDFAIDHDQGTYYLKIAGGWVLQDDFGATQRVRVYAYRSTNQTLVSSNTNIEYDIATVDPYSMMTADGEFTIPTGKGGSYLVTATAAFDSVSNTTGTFRAVVIIRDRAAVITAFPAGLAGSVTQMPAAIASHSVMIDCIPGDILVAVASQDATGAIDLQAIDNVMSIYIIRVASE